MKRPAVQPDGVRVLDETGGRGDRARHADADRGCLARDRFGAGDEVHQRAHGAIIAAPWGGHTVPMEHFAVRTEHDDFDLRAAEIDANPRSHLGDARPPTR